MVLVVFRLEPRPAQRVGPFADELAVVRLLGVLALGEPDDGAGGQRNRQLDECDTHRVRAARASPLLMRVQRAALQRHDFPILRCGNGNAHGVERVGLVQSGEIDERLMAD